GRANGGVDHRPGRWSVLDPRAAEEDHRLDPSRGRLDRDRIANPRNAERVLDVLGIDLEAVRQDDPILRPTAEDQPSVAIQMPDVTGVIPAVRVDRLGGCLRVAPVTLEEGGATEEDLAVIGDRELDRRHGPSDR